MGNIMGAASIGKLSLILKAISEDCHPSDGSDWEFECSGSILSMVTSFSNIAYVFSAAVNYCSKDGNHDALCAADIASLTQRTVDLANMGVGMRTVCDPKNIRKQAEINRKKKSKEQYALVHDGWRNGIGAQLDSLQDQSHNSSAADLDRAEAQAEKKPRFAHVYDEVMAEAPHLVHEDPLSIHEKSSSIKAQLDFLGDDGYHDTHGTFVV